MGSTLFKNFIKKSILRKQGAPGPPPRPGLRWKPQTHRWIRDEGTAQERVLSTGREGNQEIYTDSSGKGRGYGGSLADPMPEEDYWADFSIDDHKEDIHDYVKLAMDEYLKDNEEHYERLEPDEIKAEILSHVLQGPSGSLGGGIFQDLDIVTPMDDEGLDNAMEAVHDAVMDSLESHWKLGRGISDTEVPYSTKRQGETTGPYQSTGLHYD